MDAAKGYTIAWKGLAPGLHTFDFEVGDALFEAFESNEIKGGSCRVHVDLTRSETLLDLVVGIAGRVTVVCDRCLEDCPVPIDYRGRLLVHLSDTAGEYDGDEMWVSPSEGSVDLTQYIYESIVLSLPYRRVHPEGECDPDMTERFTVASDQELARIEARAAAAGDLSVPDEAQGRLEAFKRRLEQEQDKKKE